METYYKNLGKVCVTAEGKHTSNKEYESLSIVYDENRKKSYISIIDVPVGINIDNTKYWQCIGSGKVNDDGIINLSYITDDNKLIIYTLEEAINVVNEEDRRVGALLTFYEKSEDITKQPSWALYQYNSVSIDGWNNISNWIPVYYNRLKFVGWFDSETELVKAFPNPYPGSYAYVGTNYKNSTIYKCKEYNKWVNTNVLVNDFMQIVISGDITINKEGHWVINNIDTGISVYGVVEIESSAHVLPYGETPTVESELVDAEEEIGKKAILKFGIPEGKQGNPTNISSATATVQMLPEGSPASCDITISGTDSNKILNFAFKLPYGSAQPVTHATFTINATPSDAIIKINGEIKSSLVVTKGTSVNWKVSKTGYITQSGNKVVNEDTALNINLTQVEENYSNLEIVIDE